MIIYPSWDWRSSMLVKGAMAKLLSSSLYLIWAWKLMKNITNSLMDTVTDPRYFDAGSVVWNSDQSNQGMDEHIYYPANVETIIYPRTWFNTGFTNIVLIKRHLFFVCLGFCLVEFVVVVVAAAVGGGVFVCITKICNYSWCFHFPVVAPWYTFHIVWCAWIPSSIKSSRIFSSLGSGISSIPDKLCRKMLSKPPCPLARAMPT